MTTEAQARHYDRVQKERKSLIPKMNVVLGPPRMLACCSCGKDARMLFHEGANNPYSVRCQDSDLLAHRGGSEVSYGKTERGAAVAWNRRQGQPQEEHFESVAPAESSGVIFPEMDASRFAELHARWLARNKDPNKGAPSPEAQAKFQQHHDKMRIARADQRAQQYESNAPRDWGR